MSHPYRTAVGIILIALAALLGVWLLLALRTFLIIVMLAGFLAAALDRPVNWFQKRVGLRRRGLAIAAVMLIGLGLLTALSFAVATPIRDQARTFRQDLPARVERIKDLPLVGSSLNNVDLQGEIERFVDGLPERLSRNRELILGAAQTALTILALTLTTLVVTVFMLLNGPRLATSTNGLFLSTTNAERARRLARGVLDAVAGYVLGNLIISLCASLVTFVSLEVMRTPFPLVLALVMFVLDLIPMVGATLGGVVITVAIFVLDTHPWKAIAFAVIFIVYQQIENHTLQPWIMGRAVKVSTFAVFLMTLAGIELAGLLGALFAIPVGAAVHVVAQEFLAERRRRAEGMASELTAKVA